MPTYVYRCAKCGEDIEAYQSFSDKPLTKHADCGGKLAKVYSPVGIVLKGSGFYKTDNRSASGRAKVREDSGASASSSDSSGSDSKSSGTSDSGSSDSKSGDSKGSDSTSPGSSGDGTKSKPAAEKSNGTKKSDSKKSPAKSA